jgi:ATP/maltotriose-dependent transcriptional regulator MalT
VIIERQRISEGLAAASAYPVTLLVGPSGAGKSVALDAYLPYAAGNVVRFNVAKSHGSLTRFVRALAAALEPSLPRVGQSLAIAHERATQSAKPSDVLATWLCEHLGDQELTLAIDDFHHCEGERSIAAFLAKSVERTRDTVRWMIATRTSADLPVATWLARGDTDLPIDERALRLTAHEARDLSAMLAPSLPEATVTRLCQVTSGAPATFSFALRTIAQEPAIAERLLGSGGDAFGRFADEVFESLTPDERGLLLETADFPELDDVLVRAAKGEEAVRAIASIARKAPQIFDVRGGGRQCQNLFHTSLQARLGELGGEALRDAALLAARALERSGRITEALAYYIRDRQDAELLRIVETHGFAFLECGRDESIHEAIDALDPLRQMGSAVVLAIKAMAESRLGRFDTAESWFQLALGRATDALRPQIAYHYGSHLLRFLRREAAGVLESLAAGVAVSDRLRAYALAALGPAYVFERRIDDALRATAEALAVAATLGDVHLTAKTHHQAAFVALFAGDAARAKELASTSLACASEHGYFDVAAGALSVLYSVASDIEDDPAECIRLLEAVGDCAAKSGCLTNQIFALVATLEIEVERGNEEEAERLEAKLHALDVAHSARSYYEALLPTQALRSSWSGDFNGAFRLLESSEDQQWSADRKALRHAEVAAYAAAASLERNASDAIRAAQEVLAGIGEIDLRVQRARLYVALAMIVLGRCEAAAEMLTRVDEAPQALSKRLVTLRRTLGALLERYRGVRNQNDVLALLAELRDCGFGGLTRALVMLPLADNAMRRADRLTERERVAMLRSADGDPSAIDDAIAGIARKLGCADRDAVLRAATRHRSAFDHVEHSLLSANGVH